MMQLLNRTQVAALWKVSETKASNLLRAFSLKPVHTAKFGRGESRLYAQADVLALIPRIQEYDAKVKQSRREHGHRLLVSSSSTRVQELENRVAALEAALKPALSGDIKGSLGTDSMHRPYF